MFQLEEDIWFWLLFIVLGCILVGTNMEEKD
jgi:hypothetical protein